jgi:hypothetical protein
MTYAQQCAILAGLVLFHEVLEGACDGFFLLAVVHQNNGRITAS